MTRAALALAAILVVLIACTSPGGGADGARTDTLTPAGGAPGTTVEITGRFPADAALHLCNVPLVDLNLGAPEVILIAPGIQTNSDVRTRATGRVPALTPGSPCVLTIVRDGQTLPNAGSTLAFTTDPIPPDAPTNLTATPRNASLAIAFSIANDGGSPITTIESSLDDGATWTEAPTPANPLLVHDLTNDQPYSVRLRATNVAGTSPVSEPIRATPTLWSYATRAGGVSLDFVADVSALGDGSAIITGYFGGTATFGPNLTLTSAGSADVFVAKIGADGTWAWATRAGGIDSDQGTGVSLLSDGSAIVTGAFGGTATFGPNLTLTSAGNADVFVAKIGADGTWAWATRAGGIDSDQGMGVSLLSDGSAIVTGAFGGTATFGPNLTLTSAGSPDIFVGMILPHGDWAWATRAGGIDSDVPTGVSAVGDGSAIVTGYFGGTATFGPNLTLTSAGSFDVFVARIGADGDWTWANRAGGNDLDFATGVSALSDGSAIVSGDFEGTATFGPNLTLTSAGGREVLVAKIGADGDWTWATRAGGSGGDQARGVSALGDGSAIVTGFFEGTAAFGPNLTLTSAGSPDIFVAKILPHGDWAWAHPAGGGDFEQGWDVSALSDGSAIVTGFFEGAAAFGPNLTLTSAGGFDVFVARINASGP